MVWVNRDRRLALFMGEAGIAELYSAGDACIGVSQLSSVPRDRRLVLGLAGIAKLYLAGDACIGVSQLSSVSRAVNY